MPMPAAGRFTDLPADGPDATLPVLAASSRPVAATIVLSEPSIACQTGVGRLARESGEDVNCDSGGPQAVNSLSLWEFIGGREVGDTDSGGQGPGFGIPGASWTCLVAELVEGAA